MSADQAYEALAAARRAVDELVVTGVQIAAAYKTAVEDRDRLAVALAAAEARIVELEQSQPRRVLLGASVEQQDGQTWGEATAVFEALIGRRVPVARRFSRRPPTTFTGTNVFALDAGVRSSVISWKGEMTDAELRRFLESIPDDGFTRWVIWQHEPENDGGQMTPAFFRARQARLLAAHRAIGAPSRIVPTVNVMGWLERDSDRPVPTSSATWFPDEPAAWCLGINPYDEGRLELRAGLEPTLKLWRAAGGVRWSVPEFSTRRTGPQAARWITEGLGWAASEGADFACWFDHGGKEPEAGGWYLRNTGPEGIAAFAAHIAPQVP